VTLHSRKGFDFAERFPLAAAAVGALRVRSCVIDGEAIVCDANGAAPIAGSRSRTRLRPRSRVRPRRNGTRPLSPSALRGLIEAVSSPAR
jgi:ATP-dependent DNA ligase